jgi:hypothetical protein
MYEAYLNLMAADTTDKSHSQIPKIPEHVFLAIAKGLTSDGTNNETDRCHAVVAHLPKLYLAFQKAFPLR